MSFSLAIFSADSPIVIPVVYSAMAGATGARSAGRSLPKAPTFWGSVLARLAAMKVCAALRENWMGTLVSASPPPASTTLASPERIEPAAKVRARVEEAQARFTVTPGMRNGSEVRKTTSRPRLGAKRAGTTTPKTERSISSGSTAVRATSSAAAMLARSMTSMLAKSVPDLTNGVRQPSTIATRPWGPLSWPRCTAWILIGWPWSRVQTVSARALISSRADAVFGGRRGAGGGAVWGLVLSEMADIAVSFLVLARVIYHDYAALRQSPHPCPSPVPSPLPHRERGEGPVSVLFLVFLPLLPVGGGAGGEEGGGGEGGGVEEGPYLPGT